MLLRRMLTLVAVLLAVALVSAALAPQDEPADTTVTRAAPDGAPGSGTQELEPRAGAGEPPPTVADVPGEPPLNQLDAQATGQDVEVEVGERVRLAIASDELTTVQVGEGGPIEAVDPDAPARFDLSYERPLTLPIVDLVSGEAIGALRVVPAEPSG